MMARLIPVIFLMLAVTTSACGAFEAKDVATKAATHLYEQVDAGQLAQIHRESDARLKASVAEDKFVQAFAFLDPSGNALGKRVKSDQNGFKVNAVDGGQLVELTYTSTWANGTTDDVLEYLVNGSTALLVGLSIEKK